MKKIIFIISVLVSQIAVSQPCPPTPVQHAKVDSLVARKIKLCGATPGMYKFNSSYQFVPAVAGTDYPDASLTSGQVPYANGTKSITSEAAFAYDATNDVLSVPRLTLSGNISASSWTTNGIRYRSTPSRLTNTTSSGTVAAIYNSVFPQDTLVASSSTTYTLSSGAHFPQPVSGSLVTQTNPAAVTLGGDLFFVKGATSRIRTYDNNILTLGTNNANRIIITAAGNISIGISPSATPSSDLHIAGSFALPYVAKTGAYTISATDYTIDCTSGTFTVTLPTAVSIQGRIYTVSNTGAGTITLGTTSSQTINGSTTQTIAAGGGYSVQSNGANWTCVGKW